MNTTSSICSCLPTKLGCSSLYLFNIVSEGIRPSNHTCSLTALVQAVQLHPKSPLHLASLHFPMSSVTSADHKQLLIRCGL